MRTAGFVLVGGKSSRMRQDKALLRWGDCTLAQSIAERVRAACGNVALVGRSGIPSLIDFDCIPDRRPGLGPMAGIEAALLSGRGDLNLIVACDMPALETKWLKRLLIAAENHKSRCVVATDIGGRVHPLCAVYHSECLSTVEQALDSGHLKLMDLLFELRAEYLAVNGAIWNINTPEEWRLSQETANGR